MPNTRKETTVTIITGPFPKLSLSEEHAAWLERRAITSEIAEEAGLWSRGRDLIIPYFLDGTQVFNKIRGAGKKFWVEPSGVPLILWNVDSLKDVSSDMLIVCEGEMDCLAWMVAGAPAVVSVPNGAAGKPTVGDVDPLEDKRFAYLWNDHGELLPVLDKFRKIIISTDADEPGVILGSELALRFGEDRCWRLEYPGGCKDANDVLKKFGIEGLDDLLKRARPVTPPKLVRFDEIPEDTRKAYPVGMGLSDHIKVCPPELFVVSGAPGAGKSQFTLNIVANLARIHGLKGAILQLEDSPHRNKRDLLAYANAWRHTSENGRAIGCEPREWINRMFVTISPAEGEDDAYTISWLKRRIREAAHVHDCKWVLLDPWNEIEHMWGINETEVAYTNKALADLKKVARTLEIALFVVTHPSKSGGQKWSIAEMSLYDVSGSAAFKNKADHGVVLLRPSVESPRVYVKIDKSKDHDKLGFPGIVTMDYNPKTAIYEFVGKGVVKDPSDEG
jgi:twinkle protein